MTPALPANVISLSLSQRAWNGVQLRVANFQCAGEVTHRLPQQHQARLSVVLEEFGGLCEPRLRANRPCPIEHIPRHMYFAPADLEVWGYTKDAKRVVDATLAFDMTVLGERLETYFDPSLSEVPQLRFANDRIWTLVKLLSEVVGDPDPSMQLYGDGITAAPYQWQLDARIRRAQALLVHSDASLGEISQATGFADTVHFGRSFRKLAGVTPGVWRRDRKR